MSYMDRVHMVAEKWWEIWFKVNMTDDDFDRYDADLKKYEVDHFDVQREISRIYEMNK